MQLITHIPVPWLGMSEAIGLLFLHASIMYAGTALHFLLLYQEPYNCTFKAHCLNIPVATYYSGTKIFNCLRKAIKGTSSKPEKFKIALKHYLLTHSFYSLDEFFSKQ
jgi:hypothetical protein